MTRKTGGKFATSEVVLDMFQRQLLSYMMASIYIVRSLCIIF